MDTYNNNEIIAEDIHWQEELPPIRAFEWIYFFVMVIYMAQMTPDTARMVGQLSGNPIPFLIPIALTAILLFRNKISFANRNFLRALCIASLWSIAIIIKYSMSTTEEFSYLFFLFYTIFIAYIHIRVFGADIFYMYEKIMVWMGLIAIVLWIPTVIAPGFAKSLYSIGEDTTYGNNILYIFNYMDPIKGQEFRNAGFSWEPGRFSIMIALGIYCNLLLNGFCLRNNKSLWILLVAMASTMSTTGYSVTMIILLLFYFKNLSFGKAVLLTIAIVPLTTYIFTLDFMGNKIGKQIDTASNISSYAFTYTNQKHANGEYAYSLDRFPSMIFEWQNIKNDPLLGYSRNREHSYFYKNISTNVGLTGGLLKIFGEYGIMFGILLYIALIKASRKASRTFDSGATLALFFTLAICSISYLVFGIPIYTAFWFYDLFLEDEKCENQIEYEDSVEDMSYTEISPQ